MEAREIEISETVPASKKLQAKDAADLLKTGTKLIAMKGKKVTEYDTSKNLPSEAIESMLGPTGNLRAPTIKIGKTYLVGFNEEVFEKAFG